MTLRTVRRADTFQSLEQDRFRSSGAREVADNVSAVEVSIDGTPLGQVTVLSDTVTLAVNATNAVCDVDVVEHRIDGGAWTELADGDGVWETTIDTTQSGDGDHTLKVEVKDGAGNVRTKAFGITIDNLL